MTVFVLASANADKAREVAEILGPDVALRPRPDTIGDIEESGLTLLDNARIKAHAVAVATGHPAIADDTGLEVDALNGRPGVISARYAGPTATYEDNVTRLLAEMAGVPALARSARFRTIAVAAWPDGRELVTEGVAEGAIASHARGTGGFGYDAVFVPEDGGGGTFAEMPLDEKNRLSHRGRAFRALAGKLPRP